MALFATISLLINLSRHNLNNGLFIIMELDKLPELSAKTTKITKLSVSSKKANVEQLHCEPRPRA